MTPVRTAVVGLGYWGPNLVRNLFELPSAEVVLVCDSRPEAVDNVVRRYPSISSTAEFTEVLAEPSVEAVVVATPIGTHRDLARASIEAGKHTLVEKPLADSSSAASELAHAAAERDLVLMAGHTFLYSPPVEAVQQMISSGELGDIYFVSTSRVNLGLHQPDASVVWDLGPHDFSILQYWLREVPTHVAALSRGCVVPGIPDVAFVNLEYESGIVAHAELAWLAPSKLRRTTVVGSRKMVVYDDTSNEPVRVFDTGVTLRDPESFGEYRLSYRTGDIVSPRIDVTEPLSRELDDFCTAIRTGSRPRASADLGVDVVRVIEAAERSLAVGGARTPVAPEIEQLRTAAG